MSQDHPTTKPTKERRTKSNDADLSSFLVLGGGESEYTCLAIFGARISTSVYGLKPDGAVYLLPKKKKKL